MRAGDKVLYNGEESVILVEYNDDYVYINTVIDSMVSKSDLILLESASVSCDKVNTTNIVENK
jgi:hypothetical protein